LVIEERERADEHNAHMGAECDRFLEPLSNTSKICEHGVDDYFKRNYIKQETNKYYCNCENLLGIGPSALLHWNRVVAI
jgi:hypothetical protein